MKKIFTTILLNSKQQASVLSGLRITLLLTKSASILRRSMLLRISKANTLTFISIFQVLSKMYLQAVTA